MSRAMWFVAGAGAGVYGMVRAKRLAEALTVDGLQDRVGAAVVGLRMLRDEVAQGRADAEDELRERYGLLPHRPHAHRELAAASTTTPAPALDRPAAPPTEQEEGH